MSIDPRFTSRKFLLVVALPIFLIINNFFALLTPEQVKQVTDLMMVFIGAEGIADVVERYQGWVGDKPDDNLDS